jgi:transposase
MTLTIGMDLGYKTSRFCVIDKAGEMVSEGGLATTGKAISEKFAGLKRSRIAIEVGTHSPWVTRLLVELGHEVIVANPRQLKLITESSRKSDRVDAQTLAHLARIDPALLRPIRHRSERAQRDLMVVRARAALVQARTSLVNTARGLAKAIGERLPKVDAEAPDMEDASGLPRSLREALRPLLETVEHLTAKIKAADKQIERLARTEYPETELLMQVSGVRPLIALTFVLTGGRQGQIPEKPGCRLLFRAEAATPRLGRTTAAVADHQRGEHVPACASGKGGAVHSEPAGTRY